MEVVQAAAYQDDLLNQSAINLLSPHSHMNDICIASSQQLGLHRGCWWVETDEKAHLCLFTFQDASKFSHHRRSDMFSSLHREPKQTFPPTSTEEESCAP